MRKIFTVVALVISLFLVSCTGSGNAPTKTLRVDMSEFMFTPGEYIVPAGQQITVELKNKGAIKHDFIILKKGAVVEGSFDREKRKDDIYFHAELDSNNADTFTFIAPAEAGEYQVICGIPGHFQAGMIGKLTVVTP